MFCPPHPNSSGWIIKPVGVALSLDGVRLAWLRGFWPYHLP